MKCLKCESEWVSPNYDKTLLNCFFCGALLPNEETEKGLMLKIIQRYTDDIYTKPEEFCVIISNLFTKFVKISKLLQVIVKNGGAEAVLKLKDLPDDVYSESYNNMLEKFSEDTFIIKETITPAMDLLSFGLGKSFGEVEVNVDEKYTLKEFINMFHIVNKFSYSYLLETLLDKNILDHNDFKKYLKLYNIFNCDRFIDFSKDFEIFNVEKFIDDNVTCFDDLADIFFKFDIFDDRYLNNKK